MLSAKCEDGDFGGSVEPCPADSPEAAVNVKFFVLDLVHSGVESSCLSRKPAGEAPANLCSVSMAAHYGVDGVFVEFVYCPGVVCEGYDCFSLRNVLKCVVGFEIADPEVSQAHKPE